MSLTELLAISPVDGRYREDVQELATFCSEFVLIKNRVKVEVEYLLALETVGMTHFGSEERALLKSTYENLTEEDAQLIKDIETKGVQGINNGKKTDHDVKAVELFLKNKCKKFIDKVPEDLRDRYLSLKKSRVVPRFPYFRGC
jgi:adenylosuccinate lyase